MQTNKPTLDRLFNNLSSIYNKDNGMLNSNMYVLLNAYAEVFDDARRKLSQVADDTYIISANADALDANFGTIINFPKPPRLSSTPNGDNIYRFMLSSLFENFLSGSTVATMESILGSSLSLLTIDPNTADYLSVVNYSQLRYYDTAIELANNAVQVSGNTILGPARISDIFIDPPSIGVSAYDDVTKTISFTGTVQTGVTYKFLYQRDNSSYNNTDWMNLTNQNIYDVSPMNLRSGTVATFNNPEFSYWWNTFNADGAGVVVNEYEITEKDSSIVWRLPEKAVSFISPYTNQIIERSFDFYNLSGTSFDLSKVTEYNPDVFFSDLPENYLTDVSGKPSNFYVRYSANNNGPFVELSPFSGTFTKYVKKMVGIEFASSNFGPLDFFEKNNNFSLTDPFGAGTKHIWLNVPNTNGKYIINNTNFSERPFSLHENTMFEEGFNNGLGQIAGNFSNYSGNIVNVRLSEPPPTPLETKESCVLLASTSSGLTTSIYPTISTNVASGANYLQVDFYDPINSGTATYVDIIRTGNSNKFQQFRFGVDANIYDFIKVNAPVDPSTNPLISGVIATYTGNSFTFNPTVYDKVFTNTKDYGFLETYFNSYESKDYVLRDKLNQTPYINPPIYSGSVILSSGSPYSIYSSGIYVTNFPQNNPNGLIPNLTTNDLLKNADTFEIDFDVAVSSTSPSTSGTNFFAMFRVAIPAGKIKIRNGAYFGDGIYIVKSSNYNLDGLPLSPLIVGTSADNLVSIPPAQQAAYFQPLGFANIASPTFDIDTIWLQREYAIGSNRWSSKFLLLAAGQEVQGASIPGFLPFTPIKTIREGGAAGVFNLTANYTPGRHSFKIDRNTGTIQVDGVTQVVSLAWSDPEKNIAKAWQSGTLFWDNANSNFFGSITSADSAMISQNLPGIGNDKSIVLANDVEPTSDDQYIKIYKLLIGNATLRQTYLDSVMQSLNAYSNAQILYNNLNPLVPAYANYVSNINTSSPYYYQISNAPGSIESVNKNYITGFPREKDWHRLTFDFGTNFSRMTASVDQYGYYSNSNIGFSGTVEPIGGFSLSTKSNNPTEEFSYFDNIKLSYFDANSLAPKYSGTVSETYWEGSYLSQSTIIDNKFFSLEPVPNYQFSVEIKGLEESFIFIVNDIIDRVKPAHTLAVPIYIIEQKLDTTSQVPEVSNSATDWETGNISDKIVIGTDTTPTDFTDLPGFIGISGLSVTGT